jgi:hypothetical protein
MAGNAFQRAAAKAAPIASPKKNEREVIVVDDPAIADAIDGFVRSKGQMKDAEGEMKAASATALPWVKAHFIGVYAQTGKVPETMNFRGKDEQVQFIVQDRSGGSYQVSDEMMESLRGVIGKKADDIVTEYQDFAFNTEILNIPGVMDVLGKAIDDLAKPRGGKDPVLTEAQRDALLTPRRHRVIRKDILSDVSSLCQGDKDQMEMLVAALGSNVTMYIK